MAGTAREEAERLVATVLAMASRSGTGSAEDKTFSDTAHRVTAGLGAVATTFADALNTLSSTVAAATASPSAPPSPSSPAPAPASEADRADDSATDGAAGEPIKGGDPWAAATKNTGPAGGSGRRAGGGSAGGGLFGSGFFGGAGSGRSIHYGLANGTIECCVCPICRVIAGLREPGPHTAERLATGAGDLASGLASVLRTVSAMSGSARPKPARPPRPAPPAPDQAWSTATRRDRPAEPPAPPSEATRSTDPWAAASATSAADVASASAAKAASAARAAAAAQAAWAATTAAAKADSAAARRAAAADLSSATATIPQAAASPPAAADLSASAPASSSATTLTPGSVWAAATRSEHVGAEAAPGVTGGDPEPGSGSGVESGRASGLRTKDGFELEAAAAFADRGGTRVARGDDVDHDVAGPAAPGDDARAGESRAVDARDAERREDDGRAGDQV
jgi:hypothetical protein